MNCKNLICEKQGNIATVTLNRPDKLNAMNDAMLDELDAALDQIEADDEVKVVIFKGAGRAFSVGRDISGVGTSQVDPTDLPTDIPGQITWYQRVQARWQRIANLAKNTIAQVHGYCLDSGCWLALCCQVCIAAEDARFGEPAVKIGQITPLPLWAHLIGLKRASDILLSGRMVSGKEAERIGLIMRAVPTESLGNAVAPIANEMASIAMDGQMGRLEGFQVAADVFGLASAWKLFATAHEWSISNRPSDDESDFYKVRAKSGLKAAIKALNARFSE
ncbi:MAG: enoyl-CoA hydratase/isomerase family protein [Chloroflexi bacterium]|nr:enoyl-CoA hydratase/isomerase family protein [Chloroflexota bacterium]